MIRLIQRRLIIPRGDTGTFTVPALPSIRSDNVAIFALMDPKTRTVVFRKQVEEADGQIVIRFEHNETVNLPVGNYLWDIKFYTNPIYINEELVDGQEVDSYYAAFKMPECEIRQTADALLMSDDAPTTPLSPDTLNIVHEALSVLKRSVEEAEHNRIHAPKIENGEWYIWDVNTDSYQTTNVPAIGPEGPEGPIGIGIDRVELNDDYTLTIYKTDGSIQTTPSIRGEQGYSPTVTVNEVENGNEVTITDLEGEHTFVVRNGATGNGIADVQLNNDYTLTFTYTDGSRITTSSVRGEKGDTGTGIAVIALNSDYTLTVTYTDGRTTTTAPIRGEKGEQGDRGIGITSASLTDEYALKLNYSDGTSDIIGVIRGPQGPQGEIGPKGEKGDQGDAFHIVKTYASISEMDNDFYQNDVKTGEFVMITSDVDDPDNAKVYVKGPNRFNFVVDMSGATGIQGPQGEVGPQGEIGPRGEKGDTGATGTGILSAGFSEINYKLTLYFSDGTSYTTPSLRGMTGPKGNGIKSIEETAANGLEHTYTITYDDNSTSTFVITDGDAPNLTIGTVTEGDQAAATITGSKDAPELNLVLPCASVPTNISAFTNDAGYLTEHQDISNKADKDEIPTKVSQLQNDSEYLTSFTETDPTVPAWAKEPNKPTYTAAEVGAPTVAEMNTAIGEAVGQINSFDIAVVQTLPEQNISTHTIYLVPKTGETNDVYDEYIYINSKWEMVGNTQIDLSNYVQKTDYTTETTAGLAKFTSTSGFIIGLNGAVYLDPAAPEAIKIGQQVYGAIVPYFQHEATFYGLAKAAGDTTQSQSSNAVGVYTDNAKTAIQAMLDVPSITALNDKVDKIAIDNAGITNITYTQKFGGEFTVTTATTDGYIKPYARASVTGRISKHYRHRVTVNGTEYNLRTKLWFVSNKVYEYLGNLSLYVSDVSGVPGGTDDVPFVIISDLNNSSSIDVMTETAGTYTILVEQITPTEKALPKSLIWDDEYIPIEKKNNGGTYNGFSIGVNELKNTRATFAAGYNNSISGQFSEAIGHTNTVSGQSGMALGWSNSVSGDNAYAFGEDLHVNQPLMVAIGKNNVPGSAVEVTEWKNDTLYKPGDLITIMYHNMPLRLKCIKEHTSSATGDFALDLDLWDVSATTSDTIFVVGNGNSLRSSNAFKIDQSSSGIFGGDVYVNANADSTGGIKVATVDDLANIPLASTTTAGLVKLSGAVRGSSDNPGAIYIAEPPDSSIKGGASTSFVAPISKQHIATFYGLAKAAGDTTQAASNNTVGTYTDDAKSAIRTMLGTIGDVQIDGNSIVNNNIAHIPVASATTLGAIMVGVGLTVADNKLVVAGATASEIKAGNSGNKPISTYRQHEAVFYGLAKAAGDTTQSTSDNAVGTYTNEAKTAIRTMLSAVGNTDYATSTTGGVVKIGSEAYGLTMDSNGQLIVVEATTTNIKEGTGAYRPLTAPKSGTIAFYGLAKAAGDTTQASSSNTIGTYTDEAKSAIKSMLGIVDGSTGTVDITGATPTITAVENTRYVCGEITSLTLTPPASGICIVRFTSGSTPTVLTLPSTVKFPEWFDYTTLEINTIYEMCITDGIYGAVMTWAL